MAVLPHLLTSIGFGVLKISITGKNGPLKKHYNCEFLWINFKKYSYVEALTFSLTFLQQVRCLGQERSARSIVAEYATKIPLPSVLIAPLLNNDYYSFFLKIKHTP